MAETRTGRTRRRGYVGRKGSNTWLVRITLGYDANGKQRSHSETVHGTKAQAEQVLSRLLREIDTGALMEPTRLSVGEYLERFVSDYAAIHTSQKTYERYRGIVRQHLLPALGNVALSKLSPGQLQAYYSQALSLGLARATVRKHHVVVHRALQLGVKQGLLSFNVADRVEPPRPDQTEMKTFDAAQTARLLREAQGSRVYVPVVLAVTLGLRRGEVLGLMWSDIDLAAGRLSVRRARLQTLTGPIVKEPKTAKSRRAVDIPGSVIEILRHWRAQQAQERLSAGPAYHDTGFVCTEEDGRPSNPVNVSRRFRKLLKRLGLPAIRFHDLRHTMASLLLAQGCHAKVVSERLGHASIAITLNTYSHVLPTLGQEAAQKLDTLLFGGI